MNNTLRALIESYIRPLMTSDPAHRFDHVDRVRKWAIHLAHLEAYPRPDLAEIAALLHDIGLHTGNRREHAKIGAEMAREFLTSLRVVPDEDIEAVVYAIAHHASLDGHGPLLVILQDADGMELFGAVGIMRAYISQATKPPYPSISVLGETWQYSSAQFTERFRTGLGIGETIVDQLNFHISCYENLHTASAKRIALPMVEFIREFMLQMQREVQLPFKE